MSLTAKKSPALLIGLGLTLVLFLICMWGPKLVVASSGMDVSKPTLFLVSRVLLWLWLGAVYLYVTKVERTPFLLWAEERHSIIFCISSVLGILLAIFICGALVSQLIIYLGLNTKSKAIALLTSLSLPVKLLAVVTAAIVEELIFRGYLQSRLQLYFNSAVWPVIISALIFGVVHLSYGTWGNLIVPVLIGLIFAWHYQKYRNIKILIICHFIIDFYALVVQG